MAFKRSTVRFRFAPPIPQQKPRLGRGFVFSASVLNGPLPAGRDRIAGLLLARRSCRRDSGQTQCDLTLTLPWTELVGDDALLPPQTPMPTSLPPSKNSNMVQVEVNGETITTPMKVDATGSFTGTNVPLAMVRSFATLTGTLPSTFFGA